MPSRSRSTPTATSRPMGSPAVGCSPPAPWVSSCRTPSRITAPVANPAVAMARWPCLLRPGSTSSDRSDDRTGGEVLDPAGQSGSQGPVGGQDGTDHGRKNGKDDQQADRAELVAGHRVRLGAVGSAVSRGRRLPRRLLTPWTSPVGNLVPRAGIVAFQTVWRRRGMRADAGAEDRGWPWPWCDLDSAAAAFHDHALK